MMTEEEKSFLRERLLNGVRKISFWELPQSLKNEILGLLSECEIKEDDEIISWLYFDVFSLIMDTGVKYSLSIGDLEEKIKEIDKNFELDKFWEWLEAKDKRYWKFFKIMFLE